VPVAPVAGYQIANSSGPPLGLSVALRVKPTPADGGEVSAGALLAVVLAGATADHTASQQLSISAAGMG